MCSVAISAADIRTFYRIFELFYRFIVSLSQGKKRNQYGISQRNLHAARGDRIRQVQRCWLQILPRDGFRFPTQGSLQGDPMHARQGFGPSRRVTLLRGHPAASIKRGPKADNPGVK